MRRSLLVALALALFAGGCGGGTTEEPLPEEVQGTVEQETVAEGDAGAGERVFAAAEPTCGSCHTLKAANANGQVGPNLDESLEGDDAQYVYESIVNPDADVVEGFQPGVMPSYQGKLSDKQLADLVAFLTQKR